MTRRWQMDSRRSMTQCPTDMSAEEVTSKLRSSLLKSTCSVEALLAILWKPSPNPAGGRDLLRALSWCLAMSELLETTSQRYLENFQRTSPTTSDSSTP